MTENRIVHQSPFQNWHADQDARGVWLYDKDSEENVRFEPPAEWGRHWTWNFTQDGLGIYMKRTSQ